MPNGEQLPEPKYRLTEPRVKAKKAPKDPPRAIEPVAKAVELLAQAEEALIESQRQLERAGRSHDAGYLSTTINDIHYRHRQRALQTACNRCTGYRDKGPILGVRCYCTPTAAYTGGTR